jgi:hypothetical protein
MKYRPKRAYDCHCICNNHFWIALSLSGHAFGQFIVWCGQLTSRNITRARAIRVLMRKGLGAEKARRLPSQIRQSSVQKRGGRSFNANGIDPNVSLFEDKPSTALLFSGAVEAFPAILHLIL